MNLSAQSSKAAWRDWAFAKRAGIQDRSGELTTYLHTFLQSRGVRRVLAYRALPGEPDISGLAADFELFTTRTRFKPERHLTAHPWHTATELSRAGYLQPPAGAPQAVLSSMDAVLLPGLAYDCGGARLGYGGGFYDRLLPGYAGLTVGVVWSALLVAQLPREAHDCRVDWVATELSVTKPASA